MPGSRKTSANVTAFVLDPEHVQASDDGMTVPPLPGLWRNDVAVLPAALGLTLAEMRDLVSALSLPLVEVSVSSSSALDAFPKPDYLLDTEPSFAALQRQHGIDAATPEPGETVDPENVDVEQAEQQASEAEPTAEGV
jgi:hypothetical protein